MAKARKPYERTDVPVERTQWSIRKLLLKAGATDLQWSEQHPSEVEAIFVLRFIWLYQGYRYCARFTIGVEERSERAAEREAQRRFRGLFYYLKSALESVDGGLFSFEQVLLPHMEVASGETVGEHILAQLAALHDPGAKVIALPEARGSS